MSALTGVSSFGNIKGPDVPDLGSFKVSSELFGWKNRRTGDVMQYRSTDILTATFVKTNSNAYQLRVELNDAKENQVLRFDGFTEKMMSDLKKHMETHYNIKVDKDQVASSGWHWGKYDFENKTFRLKINDCSGLEIDSNSISQATIPSKTDIAIELKSKNSTDSDDLVEIRFCIPPNKSEGDDLEIQLEDLKQTFLIKSGLDEMKSEKIALLMDIPLIVPRGRYEIEFTKKNIKLHGKSYDYTLLFTNIIRMFLLSKPNSPHVNFILGLNQPMKHGQTRYPYIVMQFDTDDEITIDLNMEDSELKNMKLERTMTGKTYNIVTRLFGALVNRSIVVPGDFKSDKGESAVSCAYKATSGHLFPLNRSFLFIVKPVIFIRFEDVVTVEFTRTGVVSQNRFFSILISIRGDMEYEFTNIDKAEFQHLTTYLQSKNIRIKNQEEPVKVTRTLNDDQLDEDEDDEEFEDEEEEEDSEEAADDEEEEEEKNEE